MSAAPWVRWFWSDYNADTAHLDLMQLGAYQRLLGFIYQRRQPLPGDLDKIFRLAHATSAMEQTAIQQVLSEFFMRDEDPERGVVYRHLRCEREIERAEKMADMSHNKAKTAAEARWSRKYAPSNAPSIPQAMLKQCHPEPEPEPDTDKRESPMDSCRASPTKRLAEELLNYLNVSAGTNFRPVKANIDRIVARLREYDAPTLRGVIDRKCAQWGEDEKMSKYLRPATLFSAEKCAQYVGESEAVASNPWSGF